MAELHPDADVTDGGWLNESAGSTLNTSIDEVTINDSDFIQSSVMPSSVDECTIALGDPLSGATPGQPMTVSYRIKKGGTSGDISITATLLQGATQIASWTSTNISSTFTTVQQTLTGAEFAAISDFTTLRLKFGAIEYAYTGPGDVVSGALAWWGLRAYTLAGIGSNAVRLREDGGNTEQDFATISGGGLDLAAISSFKGANNLFVVKLYDQVSTNHFLQATAGNQPKFTLSGIGSLPRMEGDAVRELYSTVPGSHAQPVTASIVAYHQTVGGRDYLFSSAADNAWSGGFDFNVADRIFISAGSIIEVTATDDVWRAIQFVFNGASSDVNIDGTTNTTNPGTDGIGATNPMSLFSAYGGSPLNGYLNEFGIWGSAFSGGNSSSMSANQHSYWGF